MRRSDCVLTWKLTFCLFSGKWDLILLILEGGGVLCWQLLPSYKRMYYHHLNTYEYLVKNGANKSFIIIREVA